MRNKINYIILLFCLLQCKDLHGQVSIGVQTGTTINRFNFQTNNSDNTIVESSEGFLVGIPLQIKFNSFINLNIAVDYLEKNYSYKRIGNLTGTIQKYKNGYIQLPVAADMTILKGRFQIYLRGGIYGACWLTSRITGTLPNIFDTQNEIDENGNPALYYTLTPYNETYKFNSTKDQRFEFGIQTGGGMIYQIAFCNIFANLTYFQSLTSQQKKYTIDVVPTFNKTFVMSVGILKNIGGMLK